jgi:hypothetical protein
VASQHLAVAQDGRCTTRPGVDTRQGFYGAIEAR